MPTSSSRAPNLLVDASAAVARCWPTNGAHRGARRALPGRPLGSSGPAAVEAVAPAAAAEHATTLVTRHRRALDTYRAIGGDLELLPD